MGSAACPVGFRDSGSQICDEYVSPFCALQVYSKRSGNLYPHACRKNRKASSNITLALPETYDERGGESKTMRETERERERERDRKREGERQRDRQTDRERERD